MANYSAIKAAVNAYIKANGRKEITGSVLNAVLNATIDSLGRFFQFAGGAMPTDDPGTPDQNVCYLATEPGLYTHFGNIRIANEEVALLFWNGEWVKESIALGIQEVNASVDNQVGNPSVDVSYSGGQLVLTFHNLKGETGETGDDAGFGTIGADITGGVGTPGVSVETSGSNTAKNIMFHFTNLKGETGVTSVIATIDNTSGTPSCQVSLVDGVLTLAFSGLKGLQGNTGSSVDYPFTIVNNLTTDDPTQALSAAMGVQLEGGITHLEAAVHNFKGACYGVFETADDLPEDAVKMGYAYVGSASPFKVFNFDGNSWSDSGVTTFEAVITAEDLGEEAQAINLGPNVQYVEQSLTAAQKSQARMNIGAGTSDFTGNYNDLSNKPTIPELSTDVETDKTSDTKSSTPKSVYDFVDACINAKLANYYTKEQIDEMMVGLKIPAEYKRVEYIQTDGTAYIDLLENNKTTFGVRAKASNLTTAATTFVCGAATGTLSGNGIRIGRTKTSFCAERAANSVSYNAGDAENKYAQSNFYASGKGFIEGMEDTTTVTLDSYAFANTPYSIIVFGNHNYQGNITLLSKAGVRLHHLQITDADKLKFDLYPVKRIADSEPGLYDIVSGTFFANAAGSGAFTAGSEL